MSVDVGMQVKKKKDEGEERHASMYGCAHECECREGVSVGGGVGPSSPWYKLQLERHSRDEKGSALNPQEESFPPFPAPDLYHALSEGANVTRTQASFIKGPEGNYTAATGQSSQPLQNTG